MYMQLLNLKMDMIKIIAHETTMEIPILNTLKLKFR